MSGSTGEPQWFVDGNVSVSITRTVTPRIVDVRVTEWTIRHGFN